MAALLLVPQAAYSYADGLVPWSAAKLPALELPSTNGEMVSLDTLRTDTVIVHFFATWCEPCVLELADLDRLAAEFAGRPLKIIAVDVGEPAVRVRKFLGAHPVRFPVLLDGEQAALKAWGVEGLPSSFVLGPGLAPVLRAEGPIGWSGTENGKLIAATLGTGGRLNDTPQR